MESELKSWRDATARVHISGAVSSPAERIWPRLEQLLANYCRGVDVWSTQFNDSSSGSISRTRPGVRLSRDDLPPASEFERAWVSIHGRLRTHPGPGNWLVVELTRRHQDAGVPWMSKVSVGRHVIGDAVSSLLVEVLVAHLDGLGDQMLAGWANPNEGGCYLGRFADWHCRWYQPTTSLPGPTWALCLPGRHPRFSEMKAALVELDEQVIDGAGSVWTRGDTIVEPGADGPPLPVLDWIGPTGPRWREPGEPGPAALDVARDLWFYGEDDLVDAARNLDTHAISAICERAADLSILRPVIDSDSGQELPIALAAVEYLVGALPPLRRQVRRQASDLPEDLLPSHARGRRKRTERHPH